MSKVLVTGGTGFLGRPLVEALASEGHEVVVLARSEARFDSERVTTRRGDVLDRASVEQAAQGCEAVFHCAGLVSRDPDDAERLHRVHVEGTKITLDAARSAGAKRAIVASTSGTVAVSDDPDDVRDESAPEPLRLIARFPYYRSKLFAEKAALERNAAGSFEVVVVCPTLLLGPGDVHGSSTNDVVDFLEEKLPAIPGGGLSFVDARDAALGMLLAWQRGRGGERYLLSARNLTMRAFCGRLERISGVKAPRLSTPASPMLGRIAAELDRRLAERLGTKPRLDAQTAEMAQLFWYVDASKAERELGWKPRDPMDTLSETVADLYARGIVWPRNEGPKVARSTA
jgi:dihydroflavonol-4-reductase